MRDNMLGLGPVWGHLLATSAIVATANSLGAYWLQTPVLGIPCGLWCVGLGGFLGVLHANRQTPSDQRGWATRSLDLPARRVAARLAEGAGAVLAAAADRLGWDLPSIDGSSLCRLPGLSPGHIRAGLCVPRELASALRRQPSGIDVEWVEVRPGDEQRLLRRLRLDAIVVQPAHAPLRVALPESPEREAAWFDWSAERPLSYASIFPLRIDPAQVTLGEVDWFDAAEVTLLRAIVEVGSMLGRHPSRLSAADRLAGRVESQGPGRGGEGHSMQNLMAGLSHALERVEPGSTMAKAAARAVGAYFAGGAEGARPDLRRRAVEVAGRILEPEAESQLRVAAVRLADGEAESAVESMRRADAILRPKAPGVHIDHLAFMQAELALGTPNAATLGRIGAGLGLLAATTAPERLEYLKDDIAEDLRYSGLLIGRDQDHAMLLDLLRRLCAGRTRAAA